MNNPELWPCTTAYPLEETSINIESVIWSLEAPFRHEEFSNHENTFIKEYTNPLAKITLCSTETQLKCQQFDIFCIVYSLVRFQ